MKTHLVILLSVLALPPLAFASIINPINDFKIGLTILAGDKILKWEADINNDGKNEIFLSLKSDLDTALANNDTPAWVMYIADSAGNGYSKSQGIELKPDTIDSILPDIDTDTCYVGQITQLGKRGIVTMRIGNPRKTESVGKIYAYTLEGNHLKRTELTQYVIAQGPHALFTEYLTEDKRTHITLQEIAP